MPTTDRRHTPRTKLNQVAYVHIEPDNGAIVLNASGEGLGFHSMAPVNRTAALRFFVQEQNRRVDLCGELVWTDELHKIGGLRFNTLTTEARDQILGWIHKSHSAPAEPSTLGAALLKASRSDGSPLSAFSFRPALTWWKSGRRLKVSGFARGLASGFLLSVLAFSLALFSYTHRREFGESLVRLGQRLEASRDPALPLRSAPSAPIPASPPRAVNSVIAAKAKPASAPTSTKDPTASIDQKRTAASPVSVRELSPPQRTQQTSSRLNMHEAKSFETKFPGAKNSASSQSETTSGAIAPPSINAVISPVKETRPSTTNTDQLATLIRSEAVVPVAISLSPLNSRSAVQMFFDLGRFRNDRMAQDLSNKVAQLGIRTSVVQRGHLWMSSYQVLAGPYNNEAAERQLRDELLSHGYRPRPYERGSRDFSFVSKVNIRGSQLAIGDCSIAWETYVADTKIKFMQGRYSVAVAGKWVHRDSKFSNNEYVYQNQRGDSHPLLELHFAGMDRALVLQNLQ